MSVSLIVQVSGFMDGVTQQPNLQLQPLPLAGGLAQQPGMGSSFLVDVQGDLGVLDVNRWIANSGLFDRQMDGVLGDDWGLVQMVGDAKWQGPGFVSTMRSANRSATDAFGFGPRFATHDFNDIALTDPILVRPRALWTGQVLTIACNDDLGAPIAGPHSFSMNLVRLRGFSEACCFGVEDVQVVPPPA